MRLRLLSLTLLAYCSIAAAGDSRAERPSAPPPRPVSAPGEVPSVLIPDDRETAAGREDGFREVKLGAVRPAARAVAGAVSVLIPDDDAIRAAKAQGVPVDPANPPLRRVYLGAVYNPNPPKAVKLADFMQPVRGPPASVDYSPKALASIRRMYVNDVLGCCVISSLFHGIGVTSGTHGPTCLVVPDATIKSVYSKWAYIPGTDSGCIISDVLDRQRDIGVPLADGSVARSDGYVAVDHTNVEAVKQWIYLFGGGPIGLNLPQAYTSGGDGSVWGVPTGAGARVVGGHDVRVVGYNSTGVIVSTWAGLRVITWAAFTKVPRNDSDWGVTECYSVLHPQWYAGDNLAPNGVDVVGLKKALAAKNPNVDPVVPPVPPAPPVPGNFTGDVTVTLSFKDGVIVGAKPYTPAVPVVSEAALRKHVAAELTARGFNWQPFAELILEILQAWLKTQGAEVRAGAAPKVGDRGTPAEGAVSGVWFYPGATEILYLSLDDGPTYPVTVGAGYRKGKFPTWDGRKVETNRELVGLLAGANNVRFKGFSDTTTYGVYTDPEFTTAKGRAESPAGVVHATTADGRTVAIDRAVWDALPSAAPRVAPAAPPVVTPLFETGPGVLGTSPGVFPLRPVQSSPCRGGVCPAPRTAMPW